MMPQLPTNLSDRPIWNKKKSLKKQNKTINDVPMRSGKILPTASCVLYYRRRLGVLSRATRRHRREATGG